MTPEWFLVLLIWGNPTDAIVHGVFRDRASCEATRSRLQIEMPASGSKVSKNRLACLLADYD